MTTRTATTLTFTVLLGVVLVLLLSSCQIPVSQAVLAHSSESANPNSLGMAHSTATAGNFWR